MRRKLSIKNKNAKLSENTKFQKTLAVDNKVYFNIQGNPETNVNHSNYSILNKVQLLQKQQFLNYFVKNYTRQQNFVFFFLRPPSKGIGNTIILFLLYKQGLNLLFQVPEILTTVQVLKNKVFRLDILCHSQIRIILKN